jgi:phage baseplate assembly protein W
MAFEVKRIDPLDLQPRKAVGIEIPFSAKNVFNSNYQTKDAIKNNLINFFLTNRGERYMNPSFGSSLREKLFENVNIDTESEIEALVENALEVYFPRVEKIKMDVVTQADNNLISFYLSYRITDTNITDELLINIQA